MSKRAQAGCLTWKLVQIVFGRYTAGEPAIVTKDFVILLSHRVNTERQPTSKQATSAPSRTVYDNHSLISLDVKKYL